MLLKEIKKWLKKLVEKCFKYPRVVLFPKCFNVPLFKGLGYGKAEEITNTPLWKIQAVDKVKKYLNTSPFKILAYRKADKIDSRQEAHWTSEDTTDFSVCKGNLLEMYGMPLSLPVSHSFFLTSFTTSTGNERTHTCPSCHFAYPRLLACQGKKIIAEQEEDQRLQ